MSKSKIRKDDEVMIIAGKDKGAKGRVLEVLPRQNKVIVEAVNRVTRHEKLRMSRRGGQEGGIQHKEASVHLSNVALIDPDDKRPVRVGYRIDDDGTKSRVTKRSGSEL
ncbi:MAG: 50S ribosomal protein L24 [Actinomycetota bacterium]|nr:50S ribosomal protein L24 [Actinomycetota bacterium]